MQPLVDQSLAFPPEEIKFKVEFSGSRLQFSSERDLITTHAQRPLFVVAMVFKIGFDLLRVAREGTACAQRSASSDDLHDRSTIRSLLKLESSIMPLRRVLLGLSSIIVKVASKNLKNHMECKSRREVSLHRSTVPPSPTSTNTNLQ